MNDICMSCAYNPDNNRIRNPKIHPLERVLGRFASCGNCIHNTRPKYDNFLCEECGENPCICFEETAWERKMSHKGREEEIPRR